MSRYPTASTQPPCPKCGVRLHRVRRNPVDRLLSLVGQRRRYRCPSHGCGWEGTLPYKRTKD